MGFDYFQTERTQMSGYREPIEAELVDVEPPGGVGEALKRAHAGTEALHLAIARLESRIEPAMRPNADLKPVRGDSQSAVQSPYLALAVDLNAKITSLINLVDSLTVRVDL